MYVLFLMMNANNNNRKMCVSGLFVRDVTTKRGGIVLIFSVPLCSLLLLCCASYVRCDDAAPASALAAKQCCHNN